MWGFEPQCLICHIVCSTKNIWWFGTNTYQVIKVHLHSLAIQIRHSQYCGLLVLYPNFLLLKGVECKRAKRLSTRLFRPRERRCIRRDRRFFFAFFCVFMLHVLAHPILYLRSKPVHPRIELSNDRFAKMNSSVLWISC